MFENPRIVHVQCTAGNIGSRETHNTTSRLIEYQLVEWDDIWMVGETHDNVHLMPKTMQKLAEKVILEHDLSVVPEIWISLVGYQINIRTKSVQLL